MSQTIPVWKRILEQVEAFGARLVSRVDQPGPDTVTFSVSFIALAAKLAKADGQVTRDEVSMFRRIFTIPPEEEANAAKVYNLCRKDISGFESYAKRMNNSLGLGVDADNLRLAVLDGLFHIAMADGEYHENEHAFLNRVADIFGIPEAQFSVLMARHVPEHDDPFEILGVDAQCSEQDLRKAWKSLALENHPDRMIARGLPDEMVQLANARMSDINKAFDDAMVMLQSRMTIDPL